MLSVSYQAVLDYTYHDETVLTDEEFPEKDARQRIASIFGEHFSLLKSAILVGPCEKGNYSYG